MKDCSLDNYIIHSDAQRELVDELREYVRHVAARVEAGVGIMLCGSAGTGKDHLCCAVAREVFRAGKRVAWTNGEELFEVARDAMDSNQAGSEISRYYVSPDVLWLSDPLPVKGLLTDWQSRFLFRIVDARYRRGKPCFVTANASSVESLESALGPHIAGRLFHDSLRYRCVWESYRKPLSKG